LFSPKTVQDWIADYTAILAKATANPDKQLGRLADLWNNKAGVATPAKKKRCAAGVRPRARSEMLYDLSIIQLDYLLNIVETSSLAHPISDWSNLIGHREEAMCAFAVDLLDFEQLSEAQKKALLKDLQKRRNALQAHLEDVNESLKGIDKALKAVGKKSKRRWVNRHHLSKTRVQRPIDL
jgi:hypothetical protein